LSKINAFAFILEQLYTSFTSHSQDIVNL